MGITVRWAPPKPPEQRVSGIMAVVKLLRAQEPSGAMLGAAVLLIVAAIAFYLRTASAQTTASSTEASSQLAQLDARRTTTKTGSRHADAPIAPGTLPECLENLRAHFLEYRYLEAGELLARIRAHLSAGKLQGGDAAAVEQLHLLLEQDAELGQLERRYATAREALTTLNDTAGWEVVKQTKTMRMAKQAMSDGVSVKIDAVLEGCRPVDALVVWREAQLYGRWFPMISKGEMLVERHPTEIVGHLVVETYFLLADLVVSGWGCDSLRDGYFLICVRPAKGRDVPGGKLPPMPTASRKLFPAVRAPIYVDILVEPLSTSSVRFVFQISQKVPGFLPKWAVNFLVQNAMGEIFNKMEGVTKRMMAKDRTSEHYALASSPAYAPTRDWLGSRLDAFLRTPRGGGAKHEVATRARD